MVVDLVVLVPAAVTESAVVMPRAVGPELMVVLVLVAALVDPEVLVILVVSLVDRRVQSSKLSDRAHRGPRRPERTATTVEELVEVLVPSLVVAQADRQVRSGRQLARGHLLRRRDALGPVQVMEGPTGQGAVQRALSRHLGQMLLQRGLPCRMVTPVGDHRHLRVRTASLRRHRGTGMEPLVGRRSRQRDRCLPNSASSSHCGTRQRTWNAGWKAGMTYEH